jgi:hypothetical protein
MLKAFYPYNLHWLKLDSKELPFPRGICVNFSDFDPPSISFKSPRSFCYVQNGQLVEAVICRSFILLANISIYVSISTSIIFPV